MSTDILQQEITYGIESGEARELDIEAFLLGRKQSHPTLLRLCQILEEMTTTDGYKDKEMLAGQGIRLLVGMDAQWKKTGVIK